MLSPLYLRLEEYNSAFKKFENQDRKSLYIVNDDNEQLNLLETLGEIVGALNRFNSELIVHHPVISNDKKLTDYSKFYNNLVMSKMKYFFFRENPKTSLSDIDSNLVEQIYDIAKKIFVLKDKNEIKIELANYYFRIFLLFDFLFYEENESNLEGCFTSFKTDKSNFDKIKKVLLKELDTVKSSKNIEYDFRGFSENVIPLVLKTYMKLKNQIKPNEVYKAYIERFKEDKKIVLEPFSYMIAYEIWKHGKMLHRMPDMIDPIKEKIESYIGQLEIYFEAIEKSYETYFIDFEKIFDAQYKFVEKINEYTVFEEADMIEFDNQKFAGKLELKKESVEPKRKKTDLHIKEMLGGEKQLDVKEINYLLIKLFEKAKNVNIQNDTVLFGMYSSGAFLAHMYNLFYGANLSIVLFQTFPTIAFHPTNQRNMIPSYRNSIIFDDSIRTGFTFSLLQNAYFRMAKKELENYLFIVFAKKTELAHSYQNMNLSSVFDSYEPEINLFRYSSQEEQIEKLIDPDIKNTIQSIIGKIDGNNKIDYTLLLSNSKIAISIAYAMVKKIIEESIDKNVELIYTCATSKTLCFLVAYLLKAKSKQVFIASRDDKEKKENFKVVVDLTIKTNCTIDQKLSLYSYTKDDLGLICVIYNYGTKSDKIFEVC